MNAHETLAAARLMAIERHKYFRAAITRLVPKPVAGIGTMGVDENAVLYWDPEVVQRWGVKHTAAVLVHEISHLLRDHPGRQGERNKGLFNVAGDFEINDDIVAAGWDLPLPEFNQAGTGPGTAADLLLPKNFGWGDGKLAEEYYALLLKKQEEEQKKQDKKDGQQKSKGKGKGKGKPPPQAQPEEEEDDGQAEEQPQESEGGGGDQDGDGGEGSDGKSQGSDGGSEEKPDQKSDSEGGDDSGKGSQGGAPSDGSGSGEGTESQDDAPSGKAAPKQPPPPSKVGHGHCGSCAGNPLPFEDKKEAQQDGRSVADLARMRREVAEAIREESQKGRGTVPGGWARWAETSLKPAKIPWQQKLARFARAAVAYRAGQADFTRSKSSRRQSAVGYGFGKPLLSAMHSPKPEVAVIADTSGSMGTAELTQALQEVRGIMLACGTGITFLSCDAQVHALRKARHWNEIPGLIKGGGGTDMRPAFAEIARLPKKPDVVICLTDGQIGDPGPPLHGVKVIWVSLGRYRAHAPFAPWGDFLEIDELDSIDDSDE